MSDLAESDRKDDCQIPVFCGRDGDLRRSPFRKAAQVLVPPAATTGVNPIV